MTTEPSQPDTFLRATHSPDYQGLSHPLPQGILGRLAHITFAAFLILALGTHSSNGRLGPFTWLPLLQLPSLTPYRGFGAPQSEPVTPGMLVLIPILFVVSWFASRLLKAPTGRPSWSWGQPGITFPLLGLTTLGLVSLAEGLPEAFSLARLGFALLGLAIFWPAYLFVINERPDLLIPLALVLLLQGAVAVGQFLHQGNLGLAWLGELTLDPQQSGISVLVGQGQRWLRGYGLTGHPNLLGAILAALILLLMPAWQWTTGWRRLLLWSALCVGALGLLATVSRAAWLACAMGLLVWLIWVMGTRKGRHAAPPGTVERDTDRARRRATLLRLSGFVVLVGAAALIVVLYGDLILGRFVNLDTAIEARSLKQRSSDIGVALEMIATHPLGVGLGNYLPVAREIWPYSRVVHNVPLLVTAELGLAGGLAWLWMALTPFVWLVRGDDPSRQRWLALMPAWLALLVVGLFHNIPWITTSWRTALLFGLVAGLWSQRAGKEERQGGGMQEVKGETGRTQAPAERTLRMSDNDDLPP